MTHPRPAGAGPSRDQHDPMAAVEAASASRSRPIPPAVPPAVQELYDRAWDAVLAGLPEDLDQADHPGAADGADRMSVGGPEGARLDITPRLDAGGTLTGAAWRGRRADGSAIAGHGSPEAAVIAAGEWARTLDRVPVITGAELAARRAATGASQADLARAMGIAQGVVSQWETAKRAPRDPSTVLRAVQGLEALADDLLAAALDEGRSTGVIPAWDTIGAYRAARPHHAGRGASPAMARVAAARAQRALAAEGVTARITPGPTRAGS